MLSLFSPVLSIYTIKTAITVVNAMKNAANGSNFFAKPDIGSILGFFVCGDAILGGVSVRLLDVFLVRFILAEISNVIF